MQLPSASIVWANDLAHQAVRVVGREVSSSARKNMLLKHYDFKHDRHASSPMKSAPGRQKTVRTIDAARQDGSQTSEDAYTRQLHYLNLFAVV